MFSPQLRRLARRLTLLSALVCFLAVTLATPTTARRRTCDPNEDPFRCYQEGTYWYLDPETCQCACPAFPPGDCAEQGGGLTADCRCSTGTFCNMNPYACGCPLNPPPCGGS